MAQDVAYLDYSLTYEELTEVLTALHERKAQLSECIDDTSATRNSISDAEIHVKIANCNLAMAKFQKALWKIQQ